MGLFELDAVSCFAVKSIPLLAPLANTLRLAKTLYISSESISAPLCNRAAKIRPRRRHCHACPFGSRAQTQLQAGRPVSGRLRWGSDLQKDAARLGKATGLELFQVAAAVRDDVDDVELGVGEGRPPNRSRWRAAHPRRATPAAAPASSGPGTRPRRASAQTRLSRWPQPHLQQSQALKA